MSIKNVLLNNLLRIKTFTDLSEQSDEIRKVKLLRSISILAAIAHCCGILTLSLLSFISGQIVYLVAPCVSFICILSLVTSFKLGLAKRYRWFSWWVVLSTEFAVMLYSWELGTETPIFVCFLVPIALSVILQDTWELFIVTAITGLFGFGLYAAQLFFHVYQTPYVLSPELRLVPIFVITCLVAPVSVAMLVLPSKIQGKIVTEKNRNLEQTLRQLEMRQQINQQISQQMLNVATALSVNANQQSTESSQQAAIVTELNIAVIQLSETASQIAVMATEVDAASKQVVTENQLVEKVIAEVVDQTNVGLEAVKTTIGVNEEVAVYYQELLHILADLNAKSMSMSQILKLLNEITNETHLLSLNAAIEAAGAGENGARFGVIAQQIKSLADNSAKAGSSIVRIVQEMEQTTEQASATGSVVFDKLSKVKKVTRQTSESISKVQQAVEASKKQVTAIGNSVQKAEQISNSIKAAIFEQKMGSQEVVQALQELKILAEQNSTGSKLVLAKAEEMETVAAQLNSDYA